jgi:hypothetical protein
MEDEVGGEHRAEVAGADTRAERLGGGGEAVGEVDAQKAIGAAGGVDHRAGLGGGAAEGLLAEHRDAAVEGRNRLIGVERARRGDDQAVEVEGEQPLDPVGDDRIVGDLGGGAAGLDPAAPEDVRGAAERLAGEGRAREALRLGDEPLRLTGDVGGHPPPSRGRGVVLLPALPHGLLREDGSPKPA